MDVKAAQRKDPSAATVTHDDLVARAAALVPQLRERVAESDRLRKLPPANVDAVRRAGLFKVLQARRYGGYQMSLRTHIDVIATVARGCASTAWCMGVIHAHSWLMASFPKAAQDETYGANHDAIISAIIAPRGKTRAVDGGYRLSGFWPFGSGSEYSDWLFLGAAVENDAGEIVDEADLLVPTREVTVKDDWKRHRFARHRQLQPRRQGSLRPQTSLPVAARGDRRPDAGRRSPRRLAL